MEGGFFGVVIFGIWELVKGFRFVSGFVRCFVVFAVLVLVF